MQKPTRMVLISLMFLKATFLMASPYSLEKKAQSSQSVMVATKVLYGNGKITLKFKKSCGSEFLGILVKEDNEKKELKLAAVLTETFLSCSSMPTEEILNFKVDSFFKKNSVKTVVGESQKDRKLVKVAGTKEVIRWSNDLVAHSSSFNTIGTLRKPTQNQATKITLSYENQCGALLGVLIRSVSEDLVGLSIVEDTPEKAQKRLCPFTQELYHSDLLQIKNSIKVFALNNSDLNKRPKINAYKPTYKIIGLSSLRKQGEELSFSYQISCAQKEIGLLLNDQTSSLQKSLGINILVSENKNHPCLQTGNKIETNLVTKKLSQHLFEKNVKLISGQKDFLNEWSHSQLVVKSPTQYSASSSSKSKKLVIDYFKTCNIHLGTLFQINEEKAVKTVALGVLEVKNEQNCKQKPSEFSLDQKLLNVRYFEKSDIYPLKIKSS